MSTLGTGRASCTDTPLPLFLAEVPGAGNWGRHRQCWGQGSGGSTGQIPLPSLFTGSQGPPGDKCPPGHDPAHRHHRSPWPAHPEPSPLSLGHLLPCHLLLARPQPLPVIYSCSQPLRPQPAGTSCCPSFLWAPRALIQSLLLKEEWLSVAICRGEPLRSGCAFTFQCTLKFCLETRGPSFLW